MRASDIERFWAKVRKTDGCWWWTAAKVHNGYGAFGIGRAVFRAHRVSWSLAYGRVPRGKQVLHSCDNRACVRPTHLFLGTPKANTGDMLSKDREAFGEANPQHKLTAAQAREIRRRYLAGGVTQQVLAREYKINQASISRIVNLKIWTKAMQGKKPRTKTA